MELKRNELKALIKETFDDLASQKRVLDLSAISRIIAGKGVNEAVADDAAHEILSYIQGEG